MCKQSVFLLYTFSGGSGKFSGTLGSFHISCTRPSTVANVRWFQLGQVTTCPHTYDIRMSLTCYHKCLFTCFFCISSVIGMFRCLPCNCYYSTDHLPSPSRNYDRYLGCFFSLLAGFLLTPKYTFLHLSNMSKTSKFLV